MHDYANIKLEMAQNVATLTLNRPDSFNAVSNPMLEELEHALDSLAQRGARALLLTGAGKAFCAGADLQEMDGIPPETRDAGARLETRLNPLLLRFRDYPIPIVSAVNGAAAGGGLGLALAADIVIAGRSAFFLCPFSKVGLVPDVGASWVLPRLVGKARAMGMMLLGDRIPAEKAESWGLIWQMVEDESLRDTAFAVAAQLANGPSIALGLTRKTISSALEDSFADTIQLERENQRICGRTPDHLEGIAAFREKRQPVFRALSDQSGSP